MPMIFYLDPALPKHINTITLSYTMFDVTERVAGNQDKLAAR
jgi:cytochrome c oxidase assembly protein subunit 11